MMLFVLTLIIQHAYCEWASELLTPEEMQYKTPSGNINQLFDQFKQSLQNTQLSERQDKSKTNDLLAMKLKLDSTLKSAQELADTLKKQIRDIETKERFLKEAIAYGKSGVTTLKILTSSKPRTYIIRDGFWYICDGLVQNSISDNLFNEMIAIPKCIGQEIPSNRDPCVFNSIIKYEAIPTMRRAIYEEDNFLCLKPNFNVTLEQYQSVPRQLINDTCRKGTIKSLSENLSKCGARILTEYSYYPNRNTLPAELLEYCTENDGSCKLMVAWYFSNSSTENYETLSNDKLFKRIFLKMGSFKQTETYK